MSAAHIRTYTGTRKHAFSHICAHTYIHAWGHTSERIETFAHLILTDMPKTCLHTYINTRTCTHTLASLKAVADSVLTYVRVQMPTICHTRARKHTLVIQTITPAVQNDASGYFSDVRTLEQNCAFGGFFFTFFSFYWFDFELYSWPELRFETPIP